LAQSDHFLDQVTVEFFIGVQPVGGRLGDIVGRAQRHGAQADGGVALGQGGRHDDARARIGALQLGQRRQSVHHRHLDVQDDDIEGALAGLNHGHLAIAAGGHNLDAGIGIEGAGDQTAHDGGIVHHHDADGLGRGLAHVRSSRPTWASLSSSTSRS
jgi:hypothetical protein